MESDDPQALSTDWQVLDERLIYEHWPWMRLFEQDVRLPNGAVIRKYLRTEGPEVAMVFAVTEAGEAIFVEQYKHGIGRLSLDLSAGYIDETDLSPLAAAQRELAEETGYVAQRWSHLASLVIDPNRSDTHFHFFAAQGCRLAGAQHLDPTEELRVHLIPLPEVEHLVQQGRVGTVSTMAGIALGLQLLWAGR